MGSAVIGTLAVKLRAETSDFTQSMRKAANEAEKSAKGIRAIGVAAAAAFAAGSVAIVKVLSDAGAAADGAGAKGLSASRQSVSESTNQPVHEHLKTFYFNPIDGVS